MNVYYIFIWSNQGTKVLPRTKKLYRKSYFYIHENRPDSRFQDEAMSISVAHGNARMQLKLFFRMKPSVLKEIDVKVEHKAPPKVYKERYQSKSYTR